jgi:hypothetical protein
VCLVFLRQDVTDYLPGLASNCDPPVLYLLSSKNYRHEPLVLAVVWLFDMRWFEVKVVFLAVISSSNFLRYKIYVGVISSKRCRLALLSFKSDNPSFQSVTPRFSAYLFCACFGQSTILEPSSGRGLKSNYDSS